MTAFERELVSYIPHMRAFARSLCGDVGMADDLAQDSLAKALKCRDTYTMGTNMKAWLFMIVRNTFYSDKRRSWRSSSLDPELAERTLVSNDHPDSIIELDDLRQALQMLPPAQREALMLVGAGGMSYEEVAQITGTAIGTVKSRVSRARVQLAQILEDGAFVRDGAPPHQAMGSILSAVGVSVG